MKVHDLEAKVKSFRGKKNNKYQGCKKNIDSLKYHSIFCLFNISIKIFMELHSYN